MYSDFMLALCFDKKNYMLTLCFLKALVLRN